MPGGDNADVDSALGSKPEGMDQLIGDDEIGSDEPGIVFSALDNADINILPHLFVIHRAVRIWLDERILLFGLIMDSGKKGIKRLIVLIICPHRVPHLKKRHCHVSHGIPCDLHSGILPVAVGVRDVEVFICQVVAARIADKTVYDRELPVVAVIQKGIEAGCEGIEDSAADADCLHAPDKVCGDETDAAKVVIDHADFDALPDFPLQNVLDIMPGFFVLYGIVLHKNEMFCLLQRLFLRGQCPGCLIKVFYVRILADRIK